MVWLPVILTNPNVKTRAKEEKISCYHGMMWMIRGKEKTEGILYQMKKKHYFFSLLQVRICFVLPKNESWTRCDRLTDFRPNNVFIQFGSESRMTFSRSDTRPRRDPDMIRKKTSVKKRPACGPWIRLRILSQSGEIHAPDPTLTNDPRSFQNIQIRPHLCLDPGWDGLADPNCEKNSDPKL